MEPMALFYQWHQLRGDVAVVSVSGAGDINGDGIDDLIVGAHLREPEWQYSTQVESYVVFGKRQ